MGLRARILKVLETGDRTKNVLSGLPRTPRQVEQFEPLLGDMRRVGEIVLRGSKRGSRYGLPRRRTA